MNRARLLAAVGALVPLVACHGGGSQGSLDAAASISPQLGPAPSAVAAAIPMPSASVEAYVNPSKLPAYDGPTGSVEGTIRVDGPPSPDRKGLDFSKCLAARDVYGRVFREGKAGPDGSRPLADAIVVITGYSGFYIRERNDSAHVAIDGCALTARTIAMTFGQQLEISSNATEIWAPTLTQAPLPALMVVNSRTAPVKLYPPHPGYFTLADTTMAHAYASADVYALLQPLHAVSDLDGHYRIDGVPPGKLKVNARLAAINHDASADVEVTAGAVAHVDLTLHYVQMSPPDGGPPEKWKK